MPENGKCDVTLLGPLWWSTPALQSEVMAHKLDFSTTTHGLVYSVSDNNVLIKLYDQSTPSHFLFPSLRYDKSMISLPSK